MPLETYTPPVSALLTYADCRDLDKQHPDWVNYPQQFGFTEADVPELLRMAIDPEINDLPSDRIEVWASVHAWRALGQLKATAAIEPLISLFGREEDDWILIDMPRVFSMIGEAAIGSLTQCLEDGEQDHQTRVVAADCLTHIALDRVDLWEACTQPIVRLLEQYETNSEDLTTMLIANVLDLKMASAAPLLEKIYAAGKVDEFMVGTWASTQVELGLKRQEDFSPKELRPTPPQGLLEAMKMIEVIDRQRRKPQGFGTAPTPNPKQKKKKKK